ncbi:MAG: extracellular solute-binding protein [Deltaproteobacteria bacterium]|nr:extracellular solute-binding protein [Deltaproteobacteria bacterium]
MKTFIAELAGTLLLSFLVYPLQAAGAETASFGELVKKAKAEGQVEFWDSMDKEPAEEILRGFTKRYGIKARYRFWRGTGVQQRTLIEMQSGREVSADLLSPGREAQQQFLEAGVFQKPPYDYLNVWPDVDKRVYDPSNWALNVTGNSRAIAYNPKLVAAELVPKSWDDCTRPDFKGRVVLDPRHKLYALHWHKREWFLGWVKRMLANDVKLIREQVEALQLISAGAYALSCSAQPNTYYRLLKDAPQVGETLKIAVPGELLLESGGAVFIRKGTPRQFAAQLLAGWFASQEGQHLIDKVDFRGFPWIEGTSNAKLAKGNKVLFCGPECALKGGEMSAEYLKALGLPVTK